MDATDAKKFGVLVAALSTAFDREVSQERSQLYFDFLSDLSIEQVTRAVTEIMATEKYFPTIAEIRRKTLDSVEQKAIEAWGRVSRHSGKWTNFPKHLLVDPVIHQVIEGAFGGWRHFGWYGEAPPEFTMNQDRRYFIEAYKLYHNLMESKKLLGNRTNLLKQ